MKKELFIFHILFVFTLLFTAVMAVAQTPGEKEEQVETLLAQADDFYSKGDYPKAIEGYLRVISLTEKRMFRSRAWMGLSLCRFFNNDIENAKTSIRKVLEIEPQKEISTLFYPQTFVDLFYEVKKGMEVKVTPEQPAAPPVPEPAQKEKREEPSPEKALAPKVPVYEERKGGYWEVDVHFSGWSIDPAKSLFESSLTKKVANEVRDNLSDELSKSYGALARSSYETSLSLDSEGSNYGLGIRFYPLGRLGSFSIGLSLEKTHIKVPVQGQVTQRYADGSEATVDTEAYVETSPLTTNLSFRWDFAPSWRVTPYFVFGLGVGALSGEAKYQYAGIYKRGTERRSVEGGETKTFDDLREEGDIELDLFPLFHLALGVKGEIVPGLMAKAEVGFWDGLILRAGLAFRF
ncbi:MAG: tetratricopeptide repeat protein [Clostridiales bacterium]|nr:tetratricopeptide repeat protein [Clostridiales bacterium]